MDVELRREASTSEVCRHAPALVLQMESTARDAFAALGNNNLSETDWAGMLLSVLRDYFRVWRSGRQAPGCGRIPEFPEADSEDG